MIPAHVEFRIERLEQKVDRILAKLEAMEADTTRMAGHVAFVEGVYDQVKRPFHAVMGAVDAAMGRGLGDRATTTTAAKICGTVAEDDDATHGSRPYAL